MTTKILLAVVSLLALCACKPDAAKQSALDEVERASVAASHARRAASHSAATPAEALNYERTSATLEVAKKHAAEVGADRDAIERSELAGCDRALGESLAPLMKQADDAIKGTKDHH